MEFHPAQFVIIFIYISVVRCFLFVNKEAFAESVKARELRCPLRENTKVSAHFLLTDWNVKLAKAR